MIYFLVGYGLFWGDMLIFGEGICQFSLICGKVWSMQGGNVMTGSLCDPDGNCGVLDKHGVKR